MNTELIIRLLMGLMFLSFFFVRAYHHRRAETEGGEIAYREPNRGFIWAMRQIGGILMLAALGVWFFKPAWISFAALPLPLWLRWAGLALGYLSLPLLWWTEVSLGLNFNTTLHVREGHTLVTHGPYQWVRHPMYTALLMLTISWLLVVANWLAGVPWLISLLVIIVNRVSAEEDVMLEQFGAEYQAYMRRTGRFLPRIA